MNMWRKSGAGCTAVLVAVSTAAVLLGAAPASGVCGPVDILGRDTVIDEGASVDYDIEPGGCATSDYEVLVSGATTAFTIKVSATHVSVTARKDATTDHAQELSISVRRIRFPAPDDTVTVTLPGKLDPPIARLMFCVREGGEDPVPWPIILLLSHASLTDVPFSYAFEPGTAGWADFTPMGQGLGVVPAGSLNATIPVRLNVDQLVEGRESFQLNVTSIAGAIILDGGGSCRNEIAANRS